jgi:hypothetical protein
MNDEREHLLAEQGTLQRLLDLTPQDAVIDRQSLNARLHEVNAKLSAGLGYKEGARARHKTMKYKVRSSDGAVRWIEAAGPGAAAEEFVRHNAERASHSRQRDPMGEAIAVNVEAEDGEFSLAFVVEQTVEFHATQVGRSVSASPARDERTDPVGRPRTLEDWLDRREAWRAKVRLHQELLGIRGIGRGMRDALVEEYGSIQELRGVKDADLLKIEGVTPGIIKKLRNTLRHL